MKGLQLLVPAVLAIAYSTHVVAAVEDKGPGRIQFVAGYPKTGAKPGSILIKGNMKLETGWSVVGYKTSVSTFQQGGEVKTSVLKIERDLSWKETVLGGLEEGKKYAVMVEIKVSNGTDFEILAVIGEAKAK